ncbi:MAG: hypothetical protein OXC93_15850 [Rhodospirillaceae bacterium]|nr:hypothetical protein [Rhodospirillaceae bacterium]
MMIATSSIKAENAKIPHREHPRDRRRAFGWPTGRNPRRHLSSGPDLEQAAPRLDNLCPITGETLLLVLKDQVKEARDTHPEEVPEGVRGLEGETKATCLSARPSAAPARPAGCGAP